MFPGVKAHGVRLAAVVADADSRLPVAGVQGIEQRRLARRPRRNWDGEFGAIAASGNAAQRRHRLAWVGDKIPLSRHVVGGCVFPSDAGFCPIVGIVACDQVGAVGSGQSRR